MAIGHEVLVNVRINGIGRDSSAFAQIARIAERRAVVHPAFSYQVDAILAETPFARDVVVVEREADRIHVLMAGIARGFAR